MFHTPTNDAHTARLNELIQEYQQSLLRAEAQHNVQKQRISDHFFKALHQWHQTQLSHPMSIASATTPLHPGMASSSGSVTSPPSLSQSHSNSNSSKHSSATPPLVSQPPPNLVGAASLANGPGPRPNGLVSGPAGSEHGNGMNVSIASSRMASLTMANGHGGSHGAATSKTANASSSVKNAPHPLRASNTQKMPQRPLSAMNGANTKHDSESDGDLNSQSATKKTKSKSRVMYGQTSYPKTERGRPPKRNRLLDEHQCQIDGCNKSYTTKGNLNRHLKDHHKLNPDLTPIHSSSSGQGHSANSPVPPPRRSSRIPLRPGGPSTISSSSKQTLDGQHLQQNNLNQNASPGSLPGSNPGANASVHLAGTTGSGSSGNMVHCDECGLSFVDVPALKKHKALHHEVRRKEYMCVHTECRDHQGFLSSNGCKDHGRRIHKVDDKDIAGYVAKCKQAALDAQFSATPPVDRSSSLPPVLSAKHPAGGTRGTRRVPMGGTRSTSSVVGTERKRNTANCSAPLRVNGPNGTNAFTENGNMNVTVGPAKMAGVADGQRLNLLAMQQNKQTPFTVAQQGTLLQSTMPNFPQVFSQNNSTTGTTDSSSPGRGTPSMQTQPTQALNLPQMFGANFPNNGNQTVTTNIPNKMTPPFAMLGGATTPNTHSMTAVGGGGNLPPNTHTHSSLPTGPRTQGFNALMQLLSKRHTNVNPLHIAAMILKLQKQGHHIPPNKLAELRMLLNQMAQHQAAMRPANAPNGNLLRAMLANNGQMMQPPLASNGMAPNGMTPVTPIYANGNMAANIPKVTTPHATPPNFTNGVNGQAPGSTVGNTGNTMLAEMPPLLAGSSSDQSSANSERGTINHKESRKDINSVHSGNGLKVNNMNGEQSENANKQNVERSSSHGFGGINALLQAAEAMDGKSYSQNREVHGDHEKRDVHSSSESDADSESESDSDSDASSQRGRKGKVRPRRGTQSKKRSYAESQNDDDRDPDYKPPRHSSNKRKKFNDPEVIEDPRVRADVKSGQCSICKRIKGKKMSSSSWMTHLRSNHRFECLKKCGYRFTTQNFLSDHMDKFHPEKTEE